MKLFNEFGDGGGGGGGGGVGGQSVEPKTDTQVDTHTHKMPILKTTCLTGNRQ